MAHDDAQHPGPDPVLGQDTSHSLSGCGRLRMSRDKGYLPMATALAAVDLGASSGCVIVGSFEGGRVAITETGRFANGPVSVQERTVRFLKNIMGLWILNECVRAWKDGGIETSVAQLVTEAAEVPMLRTVVDVNDPAFLHPGDMASWITELARESGQPLPLTPVEYARCILDSLALAYRRAVREGTQLADHPVEVVHIVGGGVRAKLLCQLTADATGLPVIAGPEEGTALGSLLVQARTVGAIHGGLPALRQVVRASCHTVRYEPDAAHRTAWDAAEKRILG